MIGLGLGRLDEWRGPVKRNRLRAGRFGFTEIGDCGKDVPRAAALAPRSAPQSLRVAVNRAYLEATHVSTPAYLHRNCVRGRAGRSSAAGHAPLRESAEPPLADDPNKDSLLQAAAREPRTLSPGVRNFDVPAPAVVLRVQAPTILALNQDIEVRLLLENVSRVAARNVTVVYPLPPGAVPAKAATPAAIIQGTDLVWKFDNLAAGQQQDDRVIHQAAGQRDRTSSRRPA